MREIVKSTPVAGMTKSHALWLRDGAAMSPLVYFRKPKHLSEEDFEALVMGMSVVLDRDTARRFLGEDA